VYTFGSGYFWVFRFGWSGLNKFDYDDMFDKIFYAKEMIFDFIDDNGDGYMIGLDSIISNDDSYEEFNKHYPSYAFGNILTTLVLSSRAILCESMYYTGGFPQEIAEKIVCDAFTELSDDL
jgi:hypothetical protein